MSVSLGERFSLAKIVNYVYNVYAQWMFSAAFTVGGGHRPAHPSRSIEDGYFMAGVYDGIHFHVLLF